MSESAQPNRARRWRAITLTAVLIAVLAATAALAATVTQRPTICGNGRGPQVGRDADRPRRRVDSVERDARVHLAALRYERGQLPRHHGRLRPRLQGPDGR